MRRGSLTQGLAVLAAATLIGLGAACGTIPVAGDDDDTPDGGGLPDAPAIGLVTITVYDQGVVRAGAEVVFHDPDGTVSGTVYSDGGGQASYEVVLGSMATVVLPDDQGGAALYTVEVDPGDQIDMGSKVSRDNPVVGAVEVFFPSTVPMEAQYVQISIGGGCASAFLDLGGGIMPVALDVSRRCLQTGDRVTVVAEALQDGSSGSTERIAFSTTPVIIGGPGEVTPVSLPPWRTDWQRTDVTVTDGPSALSAELIAEYRDRNALFDFRIGSVIPGGGTATLPAFFPSDVGDQFTLAARVLLGDDPSAPTGAGLLWVHASDAPPPTHNFDLETLLPAISNVGYATADARPEVVFDLGPGADAADGLVVGVSYDRGPAHMSWLLVLPPAATAPVRYPELPPSMNDYAPGLDVAFQPPSIFLIDLDSSDGFRGYKQINTSLFESDGLPADTGGRISLGGNIN